MVPPAANPGDPLPPESMALREKILEQAREKKRVADVFNKLPVPDEIPLAVLAQREVGLQRLRDMGDDPVERESFSSKGDRQMSWGDRIRGLEDAVSDLEKILFPTERERSDVYSTSSLLREELKKTLSFPILPTNEEDERIVDEMSLKQDAGAAMRKLGFTKDDSERLMRIERMLVELLNKSEI